jgi:fibronectin-binding autotransporter adhesin
MGRRLSSDSVRVRVIAPIAFFVFIGVIRPHLSNAQTNLYWDTSGTLGNGLQAGSGNWNTNGNGQNLRWSLSTAGTALTNWANGSNAFFETSGPSPVSVVITGMTVNSMTFDGTGYTIQLGTGGGALSLIGAHTITTNADAVISVALTGTVGLIKAGGSILTLSGSNTYTGLTDVQAGTLAYGANNVLADTSTLKVSGGTLDIKTFTDTVAGVQLTSGSISGTTGVLTSTSAFDMQAGSVTAKLGGSVGLTKTTAGSVTLSGVNTYTGLTDVQNGTLLYGASNVIADAASIKVSGGTLDISTFSETVAGVQLTSGNINGTSGTLTSTSAFDLQSGSVNAKLGGSIGLNKTTSGTVILTGANSYTGVTTVSAGILQIGSGGTTGTLGTGTVTDNSLIVFNRSDSPTVSNAISGSGSITQAGAGTLTLTGNNSYTGTTAITNGTLAAGGFHAVGGDSIHGVTVNSGGKFLLSGSSSITDRVADAAKVFLSGGSTFSTGKLTEGVVPTSPTGSGGSAGMGALTLSSSAGSHVVIDFATAFTDPGSALAFTNLVSGSGQFVDVYNWTGQLGFDDGSSNNDRLLFANDPGLTQSDLANWNFYGDGGSALFAAGGTEFVYAT